jgi:hypothetical protein
VKFKLTLLAFAALGLAAAAGAQAAPDGPAPKVEVPKTPERPANAVTILVKADATVLVNGRASNTSQLDQALSTAAAHKGVVMFFREGPKTPTLGPERASDTVINLVVKHSLPMCFAADASFKACRKVNP